MTALLNYTDPTETVNVKTAEGILPLVTYGIGLEHVVILARDYGEALAPIYTQAASGTLDDASAAMALVSLAEEVPMLINVAIFYGLRCTDADEISMISKFPLGVRIELIESIARLTFHSENGSGKVMEIAKTAFAKAAGLLRRPL